MKKLISETMQQQDKPKWQIAKEAIESQDGEEGNIFHELAGVMTEQELDESFGFLQAVEFWDLIEWNSGKEGEVGFWIDFLEFCQDNFSEKVKEIIRKM